MTSENLSDRRIIPKENDWNNIEEYLLYLRHLAAYEFASSYAKGKSVLEVGCGVGYGTNFLADYASCVEGIDVSKDAIEHCREKYNRDNLSFKKVEGLKLPFKDNTFDICVSFQVIEHINPESVEEWLSEIKRVLNKDGTFLLTTPNKKLRLLPFQEPWNPHHKKEYDEEGLRQVLENIFPKVEIMGIFGKEKIQVIEFNRVKQDPLEFYIFNQLRRITPSFVSKKWKGGENPGSKEIGDKKKNSFDKEKYSLRDFFVGKGKLEKCLDLIGLCKK